jgi:hypothetical protein
MLFRPRMDKSCNHRHHRVSILYMRITAYTLFLSLISIASIAQPSAALDDDYITLTPKETFTGRFAGQSVGLTIKTIRPLSPDHPEGAVFLNGIDTAGWPEILIGNQPPIGPFLQGPNFSFFNKALFRLKISDNPTPVFAQGDTKYPLLITKGYFVYYPDNKSYNDTNWVHLFSKSQNNLVAHDEWPFPVNYDSNSFEDLLLIQAQDTETHLLIWKDTDLFYRGDKYFDYKILPNTIEFTIPTTYYPSRAQPVLRDVDHDGVWDIVFIARGNAITIVFGKRDGLGTWDVDTTIYYGAPIPMKTFAYFDFLKSDRVPDLLYSSNDTIYCFDGAKKGFLREYFDLNKAELKIPSPAKLDPENFPNGGSIIFSWGGPLFDAGNFNGSGDHSLITYAGWFDTNSLAGPGYMFVYSGGKAADEKADAIFAEHNLGYSTGDSVLASSNGITDFIVGDPYHNNGAVGEVYRFKGTTSIPHKPDPRWNSSVIKRNGFIPLRIALVANPTKDIATVLLYRNGWNDATLIIRDLLGRALLSKKILATGNDEQIESVDLSSLSVGAYLIEFSQNHSTVLARLILTH